MTSILFKNMDVNMENVYREDESSNKNETENLDVICEADTSANTVIEEQDLQYIDGYMVSKFSLKYAHLGCKIAAKTCAADGNSWTDMINRGNLHEPSKEFSSQLIIMKKYSSLREGNNCVKTLTNEIQYAWINLLSAVNFFAKICFLSNAILK